MNQDEQIQNTSEDLEEAKVYQSHQQPKAKISSNLSQILDTNNYEESYLDSQLDRQYQTQNVNKKYLQRKRHLFENHNSKQDNQALLFSSSFDESAPQLELKPQRNCKSSTRMMNRTQKRQMVNPMLQMPQLVHQNMSSGAAGTSNSIGRQKAVLVAGSISNMGSYPIQSMWQVTPQNQSNLQSNGQNPYFSQQQQGINTPNGGLNSIHHQSFNNSSKLVTGSLLLAHQNNSGQKPVTPHNISISGGSNSHQMQQIIMSAGSQGNPRNSQGNMVFNQNQGGANGVGSTMDPMAYLRQKQLKYKSSRSNQTHGGGHSNPYYRQNTHIIANSAYLIQHKKGNQTQKSNIIEKSRCSSSGSALGSASMTTTMSGIKSLSEVKNPSQFISWRFCDKQLTDLKDISQFKNLTDLDISGNLLQNEVIELKLLQFLKKLNLSNNQIKDIYPLPHNLELLNLSNNQIKSIPLDSSQHLKNLTTLDVSNNQVEDISGLQNMKRLKRFIAKNNSITTLRDLSEIQTIIEVDLESNPIEYFSQVFSGISHKQDILVVNLKMTPATLMIQNYEQLLAELNQQYLVDEGKVIEWFQSKLKFYNNGSLFRTKRVFIKIKTQQQITKRSSSNFSNGSSSCGRQNVNTGGRSGGYHQRGGYGGGAFTAHSNKNTSTHNQQAFSPVLNNTVTTPNQFVSQRQEDIEQLYDEILDEEEDHERKITKMLRRKQKKESGQQDSEDEDESFYEEFDGNDPSMSCDEDIDYLQSYRNHPPTEGTTNRIISHHHLHHIHQHLTTDDFSEEQNDLSSNRFENQHIHGQSHNNGHHRDILNESTADFNKEIRQINQELRDQFGPEYLNDGALGNIDHIKSLQSTQSMNTNKKNPISFKLDLSKCTQQQSEEEDADFSGQNKIKKLSNLQLDNDEDQFDIPGLNFVKVTDESFRQLQKQQSVQQSLRQKLDKLPTEQTVNETQKNTMREPKPQSKIIIPKLQLGQLQSMSSLHQIAIKQQSNYNQSLYQNNSKKSLCSIKTFKNEDEEVEEINIPKNIIASSQPQIQPQSTKSNFSRNQKLNFDSSRNIDDFQMNSLKESIQGKVKSSNIEQNQQSANSKQNTAMASAKSIRSSCKKQDCIRIKESLHALQVEYQNEIQKLSIENHDLKQAISTIRSQVLGELGSSDINMVSELILQEFRVRETDCSAQKLQLKQRDQQIEELMNQKREDDLKIFDLLEKLKEKTNIVSQRDVLGEQLNLNLQFLQQNLDMKRTMSSNIEHGAQTSNPTQNNNLPQYNFYPSHNYQTQNSGTTARDGVINQEIVATSQSVSDNFNTFTKKKLNCEIKKIKRPQSVVGQRKSSYCIKINSLLRLENMNQQNNASQMDESNYANEYGSVTQDFNKPKCDTQSQDSQSNVHRISILGSVSGQVNGLQTKRVGHYIDRLRERNSSLQERLNGSFGSSTQVAPINIKGGKNISPISIQKFNLNLTANHPQELNLTSTNPYVISPSNDPEFLLEPINGGNNLDSAKGNNQRVSVFTAHVNSSQRAPQSKENTVVRRISQQESSQNVSVSQNFTVITSNPSHNLSNREKPHNAQSVISHNILNGNNHSSQNVYSSQNQIPNSKSQYHHYQTHSKTQRLNVKKIQYNQFFQKNQGLGNDNSSAHNMSANQGIPIKDSSQLNSMAISQTVSSVHSNFMTNLPSATSQSRPTVEYQYQTQQQPKMAQPFTTQPHTQQPNQTQNIKNYASVSQSPSLQNQNSVSSQQSSQKHSSTNLTSQNLQLNNSQNFQNLRIQNVNQTFDGSINFYPTKKSERSYISSKNFLQIAAATNQSFRESYQNAIPTSQNQISSRQHQISSQRSGAGNKPSNIAQSINEPHSQGGNLNGSHIQQNQSNFIQPQQMQLQTQNAFLINKSSTIDSRSTHKSTK